MAMQVIDRSGLRLRAKLAESEAIGHGIEQASFLLAKGIEDMNKQVEEEKHTKLALIGTLASKYGFSKLGPDVTMEFERLSGIKFPRDEQGKPLIPQSDDEALRARLKPAIDEALNDPKRAQEIGLYVAGMTGAPKTQSEIDLANRKMDLQADLNNKRMAIDALRAQTALSRASRTGGGGGITAKLTAPSGFMYDKDKNVVLWDGQGDQLNQLEFENYGKRKNIDKLEDDINRKHLTDRLKEDSTELGRFQKMAAIVANKNIPADNPAKLAAQAYLDTTAKVKFGVEAPKKQSWGDWAREIVGLKPEPQAVTESKAITRQPAKIGRTQEEWDATVKQHLDAGIKPEDILDQSGGDPMALQAIINNGVGGTP